MGGISATTGNYILYGTNGYLTVNGTDLGSTIGDIAVEMATEAYYPDLAQARGAVAGTGRVVGGSGKITVTLAEWNYSVLSTLFSMGASSDASSETIGSGTLGPISELNNVIVTGVTRNDNKAFKVTIAKAYVSGPLAATLAEKQETGIEIVFEALFTTAAPQTMPMWVQFSKS